MTRYTVVWHKEAQAQLAKCWIDSTDRQAVTRAAETFDAILAWDAPAKGSAVEGDLRELIQPPLQIWFGVSELDRLVKIVNVELL